MRTRSAPTINPESDGQRQTSIRNTGYCAAIAAKSATRAQGARTEPHPHYRRFIDYGDAEGYRRRLIPLRNELKNEPPAQDH